jgi:hypothetical protein
MVYQITRWLLALLLSVPAAQAGAQAAEGCQSRAIKDLLRLAPEAHAVYAAARPKSSFLQWIKCDDVLLGLTTGVHETVHQLTNERDSYVLISGENLPRIAETPAFYPPRDIAPQFSSGSSFVATYLAQGEASSSEYLRYLLDELNAYTHDLNAALKLRRLAKPGQQIYHRDGLAALMAFTAVYVDMAKSAYPRTWTELQKPDVRTVVTHLWTQAEETMTQSCPVSGIAFEAATYLSKICKHTAKSGLGVLLGRTPVCHDACLNDTLSADAEWGSEETNIQ